MMACLHRFVALLVLSLALGVLAAPPLDQMEETDPELTGGFFEGDMDIEVGRNGLISPERHWPNATVYYKIDEGFNEGQVEYIKLAMLRIQLVSCIQFVPATEETTDYVLVTASADGCSSKVGYIGGEQTVKLKPNALDVGCFRLATIEHELLHTLGFHHQQGTPDRDDYVVIVEENILAGKEHNFKKQDANLVTDFGVPYDYGSVLHYSSKAFSKNGNYTIIAKQESEQSKIGQRIAMSISDIVKLNIMYQCPIQT